MPEDTKDRIGDYYIKPRGKSGVYYIHWTEARGIPKRLSTNTSDHAEAQDALALYVLKHGKVAKRKEKAAAEDGPKNPKVAAVLLNYYRHKVKLGNFASEATYKNAMAEATQHWGDIDVRDLDLDKQKSLIEKWRVDGLADSTIDRNLRALWPAFDRAVRDKLMLRTEVPLQITFEDWNPNIQATGHDRALDVWEIASLFNACESGGVERPAPEALPLNGWGAVPKIVRSLLPQLAPQFTTPQLVEALGARGLELSPKRVQKAITDAATAGHIIRVGAPGAGNGRYEVCAAAIAEAAEAPRYSREHWWRFIVLAFATGARFSALLQLKWSQVDLVRGLVYLNPEQRQQTNKYRAIVPLCAVALAEIKTWQRTSEYVVDYYGEPMSSDTFFDNLRAVAGVEDCSSKTIRHTVRTWLAEQDVDDKRADLFMGHARPQGQGSRTGAKYIHLKPSYLADVREAVNELFEALQPLMKCRSLGGYRAEDQPTPDDPAVASTLLAKCYPTGVTALRNLLNIGAGNETRTRDPDLGKVVLYQLSYSRIRK
jgi:hypothetical protein